MGSPGDRSKAMERFGRIAYGSSVGAAAGSGAGIIIGALAGPALIGPMGTLLGAAVGALIGARGSRLARERDQETEDGDDAASESD